MASSPDDVEGAGNPLTETALRLRWGVRNLPADLVAVVGLVLVTNVAALAPVVRETPIRVAAGLAFVLFVPGYAFVAALFPEAGTGPTDEERATGPDDVSPAEPGVRDEGIDGIERVALSFGLSIAVVPLIGLALNFTPWGIRLVPILVSLSGFTLLSVAVAAYRRWELPAEERFQVPYREWIAAGRAEVFEPASHTDALLNVALGLSILLATTSVGYAVLVPQQGETFTEFYLLTETDDGELIADDYPTEFTVGEGRSLVVGVGNQEHERANYTIVVLLQDVRFVNNETIVDRSERIATYERTLAHNETWHHRHEVTPTYAGTNLRVQYLLYRGSPPAEPSVESAYRDAHLWVNVTGTDGT